LNATGDDFLGTYGCDCNNYLGCGGGSCTDPSPAVWCPMMLSGFIIVALALPTIFHSLNALIKLKKAGKLVWGPPTSCLLFTTLASSFGLFNHFNEFILLPYGCWQEYTWGGRPYRTLLQMCNSAFAMFIVLAIITILLMWIDVHMKSKSMQKMTKDNSLAETYKKKLNISAGVFAIVFFALIGFNLSLALLWTFVAGIALLFMIPFGATNLVKILTGSASTSNCCCASWCGSIKSVLCKKSAERSRMRSASDPLTTAEKFQQSRLRMAEMVNKTAVRVWLGLVTYMAAAILLLFILAVRPVHLNENGSFNLMNVTSIFIFIPNHHCLRQLYNYCRFTLRDVLDETRSTGKVSAGLSVNSSTTGDEGSGSGSTTIQVSGSSDDSAEERLSGGI